MPQSRTDALLAADTAAIVRLVDEAPPIGLIEDLRVLVFDRSALRPSVAVLLVVARATFRASDDDERLLVLVHRSLAVKLLASLKGVVVPPDIAGAVASRESPGALRALLLLGEEVLTSVAPMARIRAVARGPAALPPAASLPEAEG